MKAYISCPIPEPVSKIMEVKNILHTLGYESCWWPRGWQYSDKDLREADIFVLIPSHNQFDFSTDSMTMGCRKELLLARELGKPLYMFYTKKKGESHIYPISLKQLEWCRVLGMSGKYLTKNEIINNYEIY